MVYGTFLSTEKWLFLIIDCLLQKRQMETEAEKPLNISFETKPQEMHAGLQE